MLDRENLFNMESIFLNAAFLCFVHRNTDTLQFLWTRIIVHWVVVHEGWVWTISKFKCTKNWPFLTGVNWAVVHKGWVWTISKFKCTNSFLTRKKAELLYIRGECGQCQNIVHQHGHSLLEKAFQNLITRSYQWIGN